MSMKDRWQNEFDECFGEWLNNNQGWLNRTQAGSIKNFIRSLIHQARAEEKEKAAGIASNFSMSKTQIHPDIEWDKMNETAKLVAHTTAQQIAEAIRESSTTCPKCKQEKVAHDYFLNPPPPHNHDRMERVLSWARHK